MKKIKIIKITDEVQVTLPDEYKFNYKELTAHKIGNVILLTPKVNNFDLLIESLDMFSKDFMSEGRCQGLLDGRLEFKNEKRLHILQPLIIHTY